VLACVEKRGELRLVVGFSLGGERWDREEEGEEEGETEEERKRECRQRQYILVFTDGITDENISLVSPSVISPVLATRPCLVVWV
jgi:hypothetical protein